MDTVQNSGAGVIITYLKHAFYRLQTWLLSVVLALFGGRRPLLFVGSGSIATLCRTIGQGGIERLLIVTDAGLVGIGVIDGVRRQLEEQGVSCTIYDGVEPNPTLEQIDAGVVAYREGRCAAVLAVGGGSPMDAAKIIAARVTSGKTTDKLIGNFKVSGTLVPLYAIPTTAGTGSEVTVAAVVTDTQARQKRVVADPKLVPAMAALDPDIMLGLPPAVTAATGMDALTHAVESYLSTIATEETDRYALSAVRLIFANLPRAYEQGDDREARESMALAACYAGLAFTRAIVGYVHAVAHQFGALYHTPHGLANAIVMPYVLDFYLEDEADALADLAEAAGLAEPSQTERERARAFVDGVRRLNERFGIPTSLDALQALDIPVIAARALEEAHGNYPVPKFMDREQCEALIRRMLPAA